MNTREEKYPIDIVIAWVDGGDKNWLAQKQKYSKEATSSVHAFDYQDWDTLKYWFRGVEKYMPWVRYIHFVTWGHLPSWLNTNNPKLKIVKHEDYLPLEYLPTFSSHTIELNFHRIPDLAEHFIYFNDDMFVIKPVDEKDFFINGLPCDSAIINPIAPANNNCIAHLQLTNAAVINQHFDKRAIIHENPYKWFNLKYGKLVLLNCLFTPWPRFPGLLEKHLPSSFLKSTFEEVWNEEYELMNSTCSHKFRNFKIDVNQWLIKEWQISKGQFAPRSIKFGKLLAVKDEKSAKNAAEVIANKKCKMICVNDHLEGHDGGKIMQIVIDSFNEILPEKSSFER